MIAKVVLVLVFVTAANAYYSTDPPWWYSSTQDIRISPCERVFNFTGIISSSSRYFYRSSNQLCWKIAVPHEKYVRFTLLMLSTTSSRSNVILKVAAENVYTLNSNDTNVVITALHDVDVILNIPGDGYNYVNWNFELYYVIEDIECANSSSFRCSDHSCIPEWKVCDGVRDCDEGQDEEDCAPWWYSSTQNIPISPCEWVSNFTGIISSSSRYIYRSSNQLCWKIAVPHEKYCRFTLLMLSTTSSRSNVILKVAAENVYTLNSNDTDIVITALHDVDVILNIPGDGYNYVNWNFELYYVIEDIECANNWSFRCSDHSCIPEWKVCDGVSDCDEGQDEEDCGTGLDISEVHQSRLKAVSWLKKQRTASTIWRKNTQRAITALYLADGVDGDGKCEEEDMLDRELQLKTSVALWRNDTDPVTTNELGMFVHALLVSCHNPRRFYGLDLVHLLKEQVDGSSAGDHPLASLALCNADEPLSNRQVKRLLSILHSDSGHPFLLDVQAVALMALTCISNRGHHPYVATTVNSTIARFREQQREDGSFGNIYTTALVMQALVGCGEDDNPEWRAQAAIEYLLKQQKNDSSFGDFLATYLVLPVLNAKSLVDIANVKCSPDKRKPRDEDTVSDIENKVGPKMNVKYMLYIGDSIDVAQSIFLRVPENITAYEIMEVAAAADEKYRFESHRNEKNIYIYSIAGITNDPEAGKFWLLHVVNSTEQVDPINESPDQRIIKKGESLLVWYKTAFV